MRADLLAQHRRSRRRRRALLATVLAAAVAAAALAAVTFGLPAPELQEQAPRAAAPPAAAGGGAPPPAIGGPAAAPEEEKRGPAPAIVRTRPLSAWFGDIARDAGRGLVLSPDVRGDLAATDSADLPWQLRLEAFSRAAGLDFELGSGLIEVRRAAGEGPAEARRGGDKGQDRVAYEDGSSGADPSALPGTPAAAAPEKPLRTRVVRLAHAAAKDTAAALSKAASALEVTVAADPSSNAVVLSGEAPAVARVEAVLAELDSPRRRILLEAKIVEVTRSARLDLGVEWKITGDYGGEVKFPAPLTDAGSAALLIATGGATALDARISAMEADGRLRVVSRPSVVMMEGSPATIESVRILRIRLPGTGTVVGDEVVASPTAGRATEDIPVGVRLEVTPAIRGGSRVLLRIHAKSSNLGAPLPPDDIPEELSREVDAEVLVTSGETAVLGGLSREAGQRSGAGVPALRRVPVLGALFGKRSKVREDEELLVLVTPRVLD